MYAEIISTPILNNSVNNYKCLNFNLKKINGIIKKPIKGKI